MFTRLKHLSYSVHIFFLYIFTSVDFLQFVTYKFQVTCTFTCVCFHCLYLYVYFLFMHIFHLHFLIYYNLHVDVLQFLPSIHIHVLSVVYSHVHFHVPFFHLDVYLIHFTSFLLFTVNLLNFIHVDMNTLTILLQSKVTSDIDFFTLHVYYMCMHSGVIGCTCIYIFSSRCTLFNVQSCFLFYC